MDFTIKKLLPTEINIAKNLIILWQTEDGILIPNIPTNTYLNNLLSLETFHVFVAMDDGEIIGGLSAYELPMFKEEFNEMFLYEIGVTENYRKKGIARKLIEILKETCVDKGVKVMYVGSSSDNEPARQLYKATGGTMEKIPWFTYHFDEEIIEEDNK